MENGKSLNGLLLVDKPKDWTSHDVVAKVRGILKKQAKKKVKVGHTGTLDPKATGLMLLVVGSYCKRASEFSKLDKTYEVTMKLGETSTTGDSEGEKTFVSDKAPSEMLIKNAIAFFIGVHGQVPPAYSAIKVGGKRAYKLAHQGKAVKLEPRKVKVYSIQLTDYSYPVVKFTTEVSSGTYIRSLAEDIGQKLATGAYLTDLRRISVGEFSINDSQKLTELNIDKIQ
jgi:tRNA pseudouridine55 synthase